MDKKLKASADEIRAAIKGRDPKGYTQVNLSDVGRVLAAIPKEEHEKAALNDDLWCELSVGVQNNPKNTVAFQLTGHLADMVEVFDRVSGPEA